MAFAAAVHFSMVNQRLRGNAGDSGWIWAASLSVATLTGYLRYAAGKHHPSDILAGAVLGSFVGWLMPTLHESDPPDGTVSTPMLTFGASF